MSKQVMYVEQPKHLELRCLTHQVGHGRMLTPISPKNISLVSKHRSITWQTAPVSSLHVIGSVVSNQAWIRSSTFAWQLAGQKWWTILRKYCGTVPNWGIHKTRPTIFKAHQILSNLITSQELHIFQQLFKTCSIEDFRDPLLSQQKSVLDSYPTFIQPSCLEVGIHRAFADLLGISPRCAKRCAQQCAAVRSEDIDVEKTLWMLRISTDAMDGCICCACANQTGIWRSGDTEKLNCELWKRKSGKAWTSWRMD